MREKGVYEREREHDGALREAERASERARELARRIEGRKARLVDLDGMIRTMEAEEEDHKAALPKEEAELKAAQEAATAAWAAEERAHRAHMEAIEKRRAERADERIRQREVLAPEEVSDAATRLN